MAGINDILSGVFMLAIGGLLIYLFYRLRDVSNQLNSINEFISTKVSQSIDAAASAAAIESVNHEKIVLSVLDRVDVVDTLRKRIYALEEAEAVASVTTIFASEAATCRLIPSASSAVAESAVPGSIVEIVEDEEEQVSTDQKGSGVASVEEDIPETIDANLIEQIVNQQSEELKLIANEILSVQ